MNRSITTLRWLPLVLGCLMLSGCIRFYGYEQKTIHVIEQATERPVANAYITVSYSVPHLPIINNPGPIEATTNHTGTVSVRLPKWENWEVWHVRWYADGDQTMVFLPPREWRPSFEHQPDFGQIKQVGKDLFLRVRHP